MLIKGGRNKVKKRGTTNIAEGKKRQVTFVLTKNLKLKDFKKERIHELF